MAGNLKSRARGNKKQLGKLGKRWATSHFSVTLLALADDPNTFEPMARNLKMKARGNQKSNEANQINSSPHDTENHQQFVQNQPKIHGNRGLDWSWGLLGEALGAIWAPKAAWHRKKEPDDQKMTAPGLPFWGPFSTCSIIFRCFCCVLFLVSILMATRTDFHGC